MEYVNCFVHSAYGLSVMDQWFSADLPLMSVVFEYLTAKDVATWRQSGRRAVENTSIYAPNWHKYVQSQFEVIRCGLCGSIRVPIKTEWCALCENNVCVDHLERCGVCNGIYCSECVFNCCG